MGTMRIVSPSRVEAYSGFTAPDAAFVSATENEIKNEPMLFSCDLDAAVSLGGPLTRRALASAPSIERDCIIDSRVHMLMPGWFPCIPGWHHDDVARDRPDKQPLYVPENVGSRFMLLNVGDAAPTEFAVGPYAFDVPQEGENIYRHFHHEVESAIASGSMERARVAPGQWVTFDALDFHQGTAATHFGWRYFIRVTFGSKQTARNELRRQANVYLPPNVYEGW